MLIQKGDWKHYVQYKSTEVKQYWSEKVLKWKSTDVKKYKSIEVQKLKFTSTFQHLSVLRWSWE